MKKSASGRIDLRIIPFPYQYPRDMPLISGINSLTNGISPLENISGTYIVAEF